MTLTVSIVIVTLNRAESLDRTLSSLRQLRYPHFEVLVVDGPSTDGTAAVLARHAPAARVYKTDVANISVSRNIGIANARGGVVAFLDDDAVPEPDWLNALARAYADPEIAAVGGFLRDARGFGFQARYTVADRFGDVTQHADLDGVPLDEDHYLSLTGANFSARRERLLAVGGFDETFIWFLDETDVNLRLHENGFRLAVAADAEVHHKSEAGLTRTRQGAPRTMYPQLRSKAYFCVRHNRGRRPLAQVLGYLADYVARERGWKRDLVASGVTDAATGERLIAEVERGAEDGVREAFRVESPVRIDPRRFAGPQGEPLQRFPLKLSAQRRLRVCFFSREYPPLGHGGIGQWTRELATGLAARGHEVTVIARALDDEPRIDFTDGVWVHRIDGAPISAEDAADFAPAPASLSGYSLALLREFERVNPRRRFDLISAPIADLEALAALRRAPVPVVLSLHTTYQLSLPHKPDWLSRPDYLAGHVRPAIACESELIARSPHILANSQAIVRDIEAAHGIVVDRRRIEIVPHGVADLSVGVTPPPRDGRVHLLFVGRLEARKGADVLLSILPNLLARHPALVAHIVGDDTIPFGATTLRAKYEADADADALARTTFYGASAREDVLARYAACDLFVAPSRYESFGLIFVEAMAFGKPVVAFDVGGAAEIVRNGVDGWLARDGDADDLTACVARLVADADARARMGRAGREAYERSFSAERMIERAETYYRKLLAQDRRATAAA